MVDLLPVCPIVDPRALPLSFFPTEQGIRVNGRQKRIRREPIGQRPTLYFCFIHIRSECVPARKNAFRLFMERWSRPVGRGTRANIEG